MNKRKLRLLVDEWLNDFRIGLRQLKRKGFPLHLIPLERE